MSYKVPRAVCMRVYRREEDLDEKKGVEKRQRTEGKVSRSLFWYLPTIQSHELSSWIALLPYNLNFSIILIDYI